MITDLITTLHIAQLDVTADDIAEALWLAIQIADLDHEPEAIEAGNDDLLDTIDSSKRIIPSPSPQGLAANPQSISRSVYQRISSENTNTNAGSGLVFRSPAATALPGALAIGRALRPLMRRIPSRTRFSIDEIATAERLAAERVNQLNLSNYVANLINPVLRPELNRWFEVALVVDVSDSMAIWRRTTIELQSLLESHGAFRDVRIWSLVTDTQDDQVQLYTGIGLRRQPRNPRELYDTAGQRLVLVISDCVAQGWYDGRVAHTLSVWTRRQPVALVQVLPEHLWPGSALGVARAVQLSAPAPSLPNTQLKIEETWQWFDITDERASPTQQIVMPIITLAADPILSWAKMITGSGGSWTPGFRLQIDTPFESLNTSEQGNSLTASELVNQFYESASPQAYRLAELFAVVPLTLPIMRLVQQTMLPDSHQSHFAEVFLSGLLRQISSDNKISNPEVIQYTFLEGVADELRRSAPLADSIAVLQKVSHFVAGRLGQSFDFQAILADPNAVDYIPISDEMRPYAQMAVTLLSLLGGNFAQRSTRLAARLSQIILENEKQRDDMALALEEIGDASKEIIRKNVFSGTEISDYAETIDSPTSTFAEDKNDTKTILSTLKTTPSKSRANPPLEPPSGTMGVNSPFYIIRAADALALETIRRSHGITLTIKGSRQMGRSSLLMRLIAVAQELNKQVVLLDFQLFDRSALVNADTFFRQFCVFLSDSLDLDDRTEEYWTGMLGNIQNCTRYLERYVLQAIPNPLVLAMDEVDRLLDTSFRSDFFAMLRSWHNQRAVRLPWQQLHIVLVTSTEPYLFIEDLYQSPFNIGQVITLSDFTSAQVIDLNERHGTPLDTREVKLLIDLLGGHPHLVRLALYLSASGQINPTELFAHALDDHGPFGDHLRHHLLQLHDRPELIQGMLQVSRDHRCTDELILFRLRGAGLVRQEGSQVLPRNQLYADYFNLHLRNLTTPSLTYAGDKGAAVPTVQVFSFGTLRVLINDKPLRSRNTGSRKATELLALLLIYGAEGLRRDTLRWLLWPDKRNFNALNTANHGLRQAFASAFGGDNTRVRIVPQGDRYVLEWEAGAIWWDWHELERIAVQTHISPSDRERATALYTTNWMEAMLHLTPPYDLDANAEKQWMYAINDLQARIEECREAAAGGCCNSRDGVSHKNF